MASVVKQAARIPAADLESFTECLQGSRRILALLGAGISAASGLPTFRGAGGLWRSFDATELATPEAFEENPGLVWQFYNYRRHMALQAQPNKAHYALAEMSRKNKDFVTLSQNVDGLSQRAGHPMEQLKLLHGSLFNIKCTSFYCDYTRTNDFTDPIVPSLGIPQKEFFPAASGEDSSEVASAEQQFKLANEVDISDPSNPLPELSADHLPKCPKCNGLLRPGVVWFGEPLPRNTLDYIDEWIKSEPVDLMLVIGTSSSIYPAAGYTDVARENGARVAVINMDPNDVAADVQRD